MYANADSEDAWQHDMFEGNDDEIQPTVRRAAKAFAKPSRTGVAARLGGAAGAAAKLFVSNLGFEVSSEDLVVCVQGMQT